MYLPERRQHRPQSRGITTQERSERVRLSFQFLSISEAKRTGFPILPPEDHNAPAVATAGLSCSVDQHTAFNTFIFIFGH
jgi:hypothetical protein